MLSARIMHSDLTMGCNHVEAHPIKYRGSRDLAEIKRDYRRILCGACSKRVDQWMKIVGNESERYPAAMPVMAAGSKKQIEWATDIRDKRWMSLSPVLFALSEDSSPLAAALWKAILVMFLNSQATYWIETRNETLGTHTFCVLICHVMRPPPSWEKTPSGSLYRMAEKQSADRLKRILEIDHIKVFNDIKRHSA